MKLRAENINLLWSELLVEELVRCGVTLFCLAPGSRSSPLAIAVSRHARAQTVVHFDERGLGFYAVGFARAAGRPAAVITTSGTAVVNLMPAVVEADMDHIPLVVLSADRPPELRDTRANQTIDQVKLFGSHARWFFDLPCPDPRIDPALVLTTVDQAVHRARHDAGPTHINCMFREPLAPVKDGSVPKKLPASLVRWMKHDRSYTTYHEAPGQPSAVPDEVLTVLADAKRGVIVAGALPEPRDARAVLELGDTLGWPILPDVLSGFRFGPRADGLIGHADLLLSSARFRDTHRPDVVLHLGGRITSKRIAEFVQRSDAPYICVNPHRQRMDPGHRMTHKIESSMEGFCSAAVADVRRTSGEAWLPSWQVAQDKAAAVLAREHRRATRITEPWIARSVSQILPDDHGWFLANSMPIRDADMFGDVGDASPATAANRGASGIDGNVASAAGWAHGLNRPATLLIGDLALLHDMNSLALAQAVKQRLTIVVINNDGGGIFSFLPIAHSGAAFERYFGTPHGMAFKEVATAFGFNYVNPGTMPAFNRAYRAALRAGDRRIIEVRTDRKRNVEDHRALQEAVARAIERR